MPGWQFSMQEAYMFVRLCCIGLASAALFAIGCQSNPKPRVSQRSAPASKPAPESPPSAALDQQVSMNAKLLAEQAQRDVQAILNGSPAIPQSQEAVPTHVKSTLAHR